MELIAYAKGIRTIMAKGVWEVYSSLIRQFGSEYRLMLETSPSDLRRIEDPKIRQIILQLKNRELTVQPGFDGVYGFLRSSNSISPKNGDKHSNQRKNQTNLEDF
jgi:PHP family Zn ribbon phosphoesterase